MPKPYVFRFRHALRVFGWEFDIDIFQHTTKWWGFSVEAGILHFKDSFGITLLGARAALTERDAGVEVIVNGQRRFHRLKHFNEGT